MSEKNALLDCIFGWGKTCRLYEDSIEVAGESYHLTDLTFIYPTYRSVLGIPSARVELSFGQRHLTLRGIPDPEMARRLVRHLLSYCSTQVELARLRSRSNQARDLVRAQARAWERTQKLATIPLSLPEALPEDVPSLLEPSLMSQKRALTDSLFFEDDEDGICLPVSPSTKLDQPRSLVDPASSERDPQVLAARQRISVQPHPPHFPRLEPPLRSLQLVSQPGQKLASGSLPAVPPPRLSALPVIQVPIRLQPGECAHYSIAAILCSDCVSESEHVPYPPLENGLLILTNRRVFYVGKCRQFILPYTQLWYVSLLNAAIALHIERQFRRIIIEVEHAWKWASRIEQLAFLARCASTVPARLPLSTLALPALQPSADDAATDTRAPATLPHHEEDLLKIVEAGGILPDEPVPKAQLHQFIPQTSQARSDESETIHLQGQAPDDEQTGHLRDQQKTRALAIPQCSLVGRKLSDLNKADG